jgi:hypothetical protein
MKRTSSAKDIKQAAALRQENTRLRVKVMNTETELYRTERERDGWRNTVRRTER